MLKPLLAALLLAAMGGATPERTLNVSAAVSLSDALGQISDAYVRSGGAGVRLNVGASNALARQLISGAPVDVFISADEAQMNIAERAGALAPGTRFDLLGNQLAVVTAPSHLQRVTTPGMLTDAAIRRIAIGEPSAVPVGVYAREYLQRAGLWQALLPKLVPTTSVRAALAAVDKGAADAAIVYVTDAAAAKSARIACRIPSSAAPRIAYPVAIGARAGDRTEAARFVSFLRGEEATSIFRRFGFVPLAAQ